LLKKSLAASSLEILVALGIGIALGTLCHLLIKTTKEPSDSLIIIIGFVLLAIGQLDDAVASYRRAMEIKPDYAEPHCNMGFALQDLGRYDEAISVIKKYYGDPSEDLNLQFALGYAYYKKGDKTTADKYFATSKNPAMSDEEFIKSIEEF